MFGHERGAFTGATERRRGRFELAHRGTLFLDEVGDLGPEAQAKLLRAIETGVVERVGGGKDHSGRRSGLWRPPTMTSGVRSKEGTFRQDLLFRLEVVPIHLPPLRERIEDLPLLVAHTLAAPPANDMGSPPPISRRSHGGVAQVLLARERPGAHEHPGAPHHPESRWARRAGEVGAAPARRVLSARSAIPAYQEGDPTAPAGPTGRLREGPHPGGPVAGPRGMWPKRAPSADGPTEPLPAYETLGPSAAPRLNAPTSRGTEGPDLFRRDHTVSNTQCRTRGSFRHPGRRRTRTCNP